MNKRVQIGGLLITSLLLFYNSPSYSLDGNLRFVFSVSRLADGTSLRDPLGLDISKSSGDILVADTGNHQIRVFNRDGVLIKSIGRLAGIRSPVGVAAGEDEEIYFTEMDRPQVMRLDILGNRFPPILLEPLGDTPPSPGRICSGPAGQIYVADRATPTVFIVSRPDNAVRRIAQTPADGTPKWKVQDVTVDAEGNVYILSSEGLAVNVFDRDGSHLRSFGRHGPKDSEFSFPTGAAIGPDGNLWIVDSFKQDLKVFSLDGNFLFRWGRTGMGDGELFYPIDIAFGERTLYVLEKGASRLQAFKMLQR